MTDYRCNRCGCQPCECDQSIPAPPSDEHEHADGTIHTHRQGSYKHIHEVGQSPPSDKREQKEEDGSYFVRRIPISKHIKSSPIPESLELTEIWKTIGRLLKEFDPDYVSDAEDDDVFLLINRICDLFKPLIDARNNEIRILELTTHELRNMIVQQSNEITRLKQENEGLREDYELASEQIRKLALENLYP